MRGDRWHQVEGSRHLLVLVKMDGWKQFQAAGLSQAGSTWMLKGHCLTASVATAGAKAMATTTAGSGRHLVGGRFEEPRAAAVSAAVERCLSCLEVRMIAPGRSRSAAPSAVLSTGDLVWA